MVVQKNWKNILCLLISFALAASLLITSSPALAQNLSSSSSQPVRIGKILSVNYAIEEINPPNLVVEATGEVPTGGWTQAQLFRRIYVNPPLDGIWEYDLYGTPPSQPVPQVISEISASNRWEGFPQDLVKGIRVYGEGSGIVELLLDSSTSKTEAFGIFTGISTSGNFQEALDSAISKAVERFNKIGSDILTNWQLKQVSGREGGFVGFNEIEVTILASPS